MDSIVVLFSDGQRFVGWFSEGGDKTMVAAVGPIAKAQLLAEELLRAKLFPQGAVTPRPIVRSGEPHDAPKSIAAHLDFVYVARIFWLVVFRHRPPKTSNRDHAQGWQTF